MTDQGFGRNAESIIIFHKNQRRKQLSEEIEYVIARWQFLALRIRQKYQKAARSRLCKEILRRFDIGFKISKYTPLGIDSFNEKVLNESCFSILF